MRHGFLCLKMVIQVWSKAMAVLKPKGLLTTTPSDGVVYSDMSSASDPSYESLLGLSFISTLEVSKSNSL